MKRHSGKLRLRPLAFSIVVSLILSEIILRIATRSIPTYADLLANSLDHPERLYPAYAQLTYDVRGLYANGGLVTLRVSANRFIEPEPQGKYAYHVLFLGGSTTEARLPLLAHQPLAFRSICGSVHFAAQPQSSTMLVLTNSSSSSIRRISRRRAQ